MISQSDRKGFIPDLNLHTLGKTIDSLNQKNSLSTIFKKNFSAQIEELKKSKKFAAVNKKNSYALPLYSKVLLKIIDLVGENKCLLKDPATSHAEKLRLEELNVTLNSYYDKYFNKYCHTPNTKTLRNLIENEIYSQIPFLNSTKILTPAEMRQKKKLADAGYSMFNEMKKWLESSVIDQNKSFESIIKDQVGEFLSWADSHPKTASYLVSDIALTCAVLLEKQASEKLLISINSMVFTKMFLDALGLCKEFEDIEDDKLLKFRALSDFLSYCPMLATGYTVAKKTVNGEYTSFFSWATSAIKEASITMSVQKITRLIPQGHEKLVLLVLSVLRGHDIQEIIAEQRNISLIQLAGLVKAIIKNPYAFLISFEVWWKTVFEATGLERTKRIIAGLIMPAFAIGVFAAGIFSAFNAPLFSAVTILAKPAIITAATLSLSYLFTNLIDANDGYKTKNAVILSINKREEREELLRASHFLSTNAEKQQEINKQAKTYISDLQKKHSLPQIPTIKPDSLDGSSKEIVEKIKTLCVEQLKTKVTLKKNNLTPAEVVTLFNEVVALKKFRGKLQEPDKKIEDLIIFSVAQELMDEWLVENLEQAFKVKLLDLYYVNKEDYLKVKPINVDEYLKTTIKQKIKDEVDIHDASNRESVFKSLRKTNII